MRNLYVVTHPQATHHVEGVVGGWHNSALTPHGLAGAEAIAGALRHRIPIGSEVEVYTSDLLRTRQTAAAIGAVLRVEPVLDGRLREKSYGVAEGRPQAWLDQRFVPPPATGNRLHHREGITGAETRAACAQRVFAAMDMILASTCPDQVIVTHGFAATFVLAAWIGMTPESLGSVSFRVAPGSISFLHEDDYFHNRAIITLGETGHLGPFQPDQPAG